VRRARAIATLVALLVFGGVALRAALGLLDGPARGSAIVVGSKAFHESVILAEILAQRLERAGLPVLRRHYLGGTSICFEALRSGAIDLYPEYTGTALQAILHERAPADPAGVLPVVRRLLAERFGLVWLAPLGFDNAYALAVPRALAARLGLRSISDLVLHPELRAGFASEFLAREDGWPGLRERYSLAFREPPRSMEAGLMYQAAAAGEVDVISAYSTDGRLRTMDLQLLLDDRRFFPPYQAAAVVRQAVLALHPTAKPALEELAGTLSNDDMQAMNLEVDSGRRSPADVARTFLDRKRTR
jgi:glycine betaine/choline ABC-type transport system substrate-binding protein